MENNKKKMNKTANIILIGLVIVVVGLFIWKGNKDDSLTQLETTRPKISTISKKRFITGHLYPETEINVKSSISGVIEKLYIEEGEEVTTGDKIAKIQMIPDPTEIEALRKKVTKARIRYEADKKAYKRKKHLFDKGLIAEAEYEKVKQQFELSRTEFESAKNRLELTLEGEASGIEDISNIVRAPTDGTVLRIPVKLGSSVIKRNNFNQGTNIATIAELDSFIFRGRVNEADLSSLREGLEFSLKLKALEGISTKGILSKISPKGEKEQGVMKYDVEARVHLPSDSIKVRAGYTATAEIILKERKDVVTIKEKNLIIENDSTFVELLSEENYQKQYVETGISDGINIEIKKGLDTNDRIRKQ